MTPIPFRAHIPDSAIDDLKDRLARTRFPDQAPGAPWAYGTDLAWMRELAEYWRTRFDWRAQEARLNAFDQFKVPLAGIDLHYLHVQGQGTAPMPLLLSHGWPGSVFEFTELIPRLTDPARFGGDPADAFTVVVPSLPGYGLSGPTPDAGWDVDRMADALAELMTRLGHERFGAQGGDWGSHVSRALGRRHPDRVVGVHLNMLATAPPEDHADDDPAHLSTRRYRRELSGYMQVQSQRPASLMYAFTDSPVGLLAWIAERFHDWTDPATPVDRDRMLADVALYWFTRTAGSSAALYHERARGGGSGAASAAGCLEVPVGVAVFPHDLFIPSREQAEKTDQVVHWTEMPRGGHFAALEAPDLLVDDVRAFFASLRGR